MEEQLNNYLQGLLPVKDDWIVSLESQAEEEKVPVMDAVSMQFVMQLVRLMKPRRILEIGTAIGYSALRMLEASPGSSIVTIERDEIRFKQATRNISSQNKQQKIQLVFGDALEKMQEFGAADECFDLVFIDAAKGQYKRFFELADSMVTSGGLIISDNVLFRGYVANPAEAPKRFRKMVEKLHAYNQMITAHENYETSIVPIGDGVAISYKK